MNLSHLYYFRKLAELQHYTNAAKALFITQPTLSGAIAALESEFGVNLFQKEGRHIQLTDAGERFYSCVCTALNTLEEGVAGVKVYAADVGGVIEVGCLVTLLGDFLPRVITTYFDNISKATVIHTSSSATTREVIAGVKSGTLDLALGSMQENEDDIEFFPLYPQKIIAVVNPRHPLAGRTRISLTELRGFEIISYCTDMPVGRELAPLMQRYDLHPQCLFREEVSIGGHVSIQQVVGLAAKTPSLLQFPNLIHLAIEEIPDDFRHVYMAYSKKRYLPPHVRRFVKFIMDNREDLSPEP